MLKQAIHTACCILISAAMLAQDANSVFTLGGLYGYGSTGISGFSQWMVQEGLSPKPSSVQQQMIGFEVFYSKNRLPVALNFEINLPALTTTEPYLTTVSLESGYHNASGRLHLSALAGPAMGIVTIRFREGLPPSIQNLEVPHNDSFARGYALLLRTRIRVAYLISRKEQGTGRLFLFASVCYQHRLAQGGFRYGENELGADGDYFVSVPVDIPSFLRYNIHMSAGLAITAW